MEQLKDLGNYQLIANALVCLFAVLIRLAAFISKGKEENGTFKLPLWRGLYQVFASFGLGFMTIFVLRDYADLGGGKKMMIVFIVSFSATLIIDALMLIKPQQLLHVFFKWLASKTGTTPDETNDSDIER